MHVSCLNYISAATNMFKWKEVVVFDIFCLIVDTVRKIADWGYQVRCCLLNYRTYVFPSAGAHTPESHLQSPNYQGCQSEIRILGIKRMQTYVTRPLAYLISTSDHDGNAGSNRSAGKKAPGTNCSGKFRWKSGLSMWMCFTVETGH